MSIDPFSHFLEKPSGACVTTMEDSSEVVQQDDSNHAIPYPDEGKNSPCLKHESENVVENVGGLQEEYSRYCSRNKMYYTDISRYFQPAGASTLDFSDGWHERRLKRCREMKAKQLERKQRILEKRLFDKLALEKKRIGSHMNESEKSERNNWVDSEFLLAGGGYEFLRSIYLDENVSPKAHKGGGCRFSCIYGDHVQATDVYQSSDNRTHGSNMDKRHGSHGIDMGGIGEIILDNNEFPQVSRSDRQVKQVRSSYENFKNNPGISQPYRLEKNNSFKEVFPQGLNLDIEELPDQLAELIARPKSSPSIPSKCRKYVLVATESETTRDRPVPTFLEETLMLQRFPKSNTVAGKYRSRSFSPPLAEIRRPYSVQKMQKVNMSCK